MIIDEITQNIPPPIVADEGGEFCSKAVALNFRHRRHTILLFTGFDEVSFFYLVVPSTIAISSSVKPHKS